MKKLIFNYSKYNFIEDKVVGVLFCLSVLPSSKDYIFKPDLVLEFAHTNYHFISIVFNRKRTIRMTSTAAEAVGFYSYLLSTPFGFVGHICSIITF